MGNICGKADSEATHPARIVGSAPPAQTTSSLPRKVGGPPRTLGGAAAAAATGTAPASRDDARLRAAEAAEARARAANNKGGKLHSQLSAQKRQSRSDQLREASAQEQRARDADNAALVRNWD